MRDLSTLTPAQKTQLRAATSKALATRIYEPPPGWLAQPRRWSPRRHFGPLYGNSPDVHLNGSAATFVYDRFFVSHPDAAIFQKYYGGTLPSNAPSLPQAIPSTVPSVGFRDLRLGFDRLTYSSRYGGSFKLTFLSLEDFQLEYRSGSDVWDIASLEMAVYVVPSPSSFNPNAPLTSGKIYVEFQPQGVIGYTYHQPTQTLTVKTTDPLPALVSALAQEAQAMHNAGAFAQNAARFAHALVHVAFWEEIGQTNTVTALEISDGYFLPRTTAGIGTVVVAVKLADVRLDTEPGGEEIHLTLTATHQYRGNPVPPTFQWELPRIDDGESTAWKTVGMFSVDFDCLAIETIFLNVSVREEDTTVDDRFLTDPIAFQTGGLPCAGMQAAFNNGQFGVYQVLSDETVNIVEHGDNGDVAGALTARKRFSIIRQ